MTNDEVKKKIADIIYYTGCTGACCECAYSKISEADTYCKAMLKADALIAAGIGDVSALTEYVKFVGNSAEEERKNLIELQNIQLEDLWSRIKATELRAEVAERALKNCATDLYEHVCDHDTYNPRKGGLYFEKYYLRQAKKELSEDKK